jgi:hypothetical protein
MLLYITVEFYRTVLKRVLQSFNDHKIIVQFIRWGPLNFAGVYQKKNHLSFALQDVEITALRSGKYFFNEYTFSYCNFKAMITS